MRGGGLTKHWSLPNHKLSTEPGQLQPRHAYYLCAGKAAAGSGGPHLPKSLGGHCPARYIPVCALDDLVWRDLCAVLTHPDSITYALRRSQAGAWLPQELQARRVQLQQGQRQLDHQVQRLGDAYQAGVMPLEEYRQRRVALERQQQALQRRQEQVETQVDQQQALAQVTSSLTGFCERVKGGLARATFDQRRQLVELLIDRVVVTDGDVEIRYVFPTTPASEHIRFSHLRTDYQHGLPWREVGGQIAPRAAAAQHIEDSVENPAQRMGPRSTALRQRRQVALDVFPFDVSQVARIACAHGIERRPLRHCVHMQYML
jgi:site-specific DNA recombinase